MDKKIYWYELCFYGDEDTESEKYDAEKACSYVIKTEIPPVICDEVALKILFGNSREQWERELMENLTCVMEIIEEEAQHFDVEDLVKRTESDYGVYYTR